MTIRSSSCKVQIPEQAKELGITEAIWVSVSRRTDECVKFKDEQSGDRITLQSSEVGPKSTIRARAFPRDWWP